jgi:formylglycine-generating enzyme required for sulfatase activity
MIAGVAPLVAGCTQHPQDNQPFSHRELTNSLGMTLVSIPAGSFLMGSDDPQAVADGDGPRHAVRLTRGFWIGKYEVTQAEYQQVMGGNPSQFYAAGDGASAVTGVDTSRHPVDRVTWEEAVEFCRRLSTLPDEQAAHRKYRLPTDAEWEYACRAGKGDSVDSSEKLSTATANIKAPAHPAAPAPGRTAEVGSYRPNAWGLHDMHGNVWEWCADGRRQYSSSSVVDPHGPESLEVVLRGGAWDYPAAYARSAHRQMALKGYVYFGFRVVCETPLAEGRLTGRAP